MKKIIAIALTLLTVAALTVTAFASGSAETADAEAATAAETAAAETEEGAVKTHSRGASEEIEAAVSKEDAVAAALKDAGFAEEDVTVTRTRLKETEDENGQTIAVYTVKFHTEDTTYKYHVDANTGKIIDSTVTEGVSEGHSRSERGASGEMKDAASGEAAADGEADAAASVTGKSGRGHKSSSAEADVTDVMTDTTNA